MASTPMTGSISSDKHALLITMATWLQGGWSLAFVIAVLAIPGGPQGFGSITPLPHSHSTFSLCLWIPGPTVPLPKRPGRFHPVQGAPQVGMGEGSAPHVARWGCGSGQPRPPATCATLPPLLFPNLWPCWTASPCVSSPFLMGDPIAFLVSDGNFYCLPSTGNWLGTAMVTTTINLNH